MSILLRHKRSIYGLTDELATITSSVTTEAATRSANDGDLALLTTTDKTSLVSAINEALATGSSSVATALKIAANLSDVSNVATARTNLDVMSTLEVSDAINAANLAMGTNYNVATILERDALTNLDDADRVFVENDGDGKWAIYKVGTVDVNGAVTSWFKIGDQDVLDNAITSTQIKASYESNPDTNGFTDAEKVTLGYLSATGVINLDDAILGAELAQDLALSALTTEAPSAAAVKAYADAAATAGGSLPILETLVVAAGNTITLTHAPKGGVHGVMNFATVRYADANGVVFDAPIVGTVDPKVFTISVDVTDEWNTFNVQIQYLYVAA